MDEEIRRKLDKILKNYENKSNEIIYNEIKEFFVDIPIGKMIYIMTEEKYDPFMKLLFKSIMASMLSIYYDNYEEAREGINEILQMMKKSDKKIMKIKERERL